MAFAIGSLRRGVVTEKLRIFADEVLILGRDGNFGYLNSRSWKRLTREKFSGWVIFWALFNFYDWNKQKWMENCPLVWLMLELGECVWHISVVFINSLSCFLFSSYTKLGFAANKEPQFIIPSAIAIKETAKVGDTTSRRLNKGVEDLDFFIGDEAFDATGYAVKVKILAENPI